MRMNETKTCNKCKKEYPSTAEYFYERSNRPSLEAVCKPCKNNTNKGRKKEYNKKYYRDNKKDINSKNNKRWHENKERYSISAKKYREKHKEELKEYNKKYQEENKEGISKQKKKYYHANREPKLKYRKKYYGLNKDKLINYARRYYSENKEGISKKSKVYRIKNRELRRVLEQRREAKKKSLPNAFSLSDWRIAKKYFNHRCAYCGEFAELQQEHFIPLSKGGEYTVNNIIPACQRCNGSKHNKGFFEWYPKQECYSKQREQQILKFLNYESNKTQQLALL